MELIYGILFFVGLFFALLSLVGLDTAVNGLGIIRVVQVAREEWSNWRIDLDSIVRLRDHWKKERGQNAALTYDVELVQDFSRLAASQVLVPQGSVPTTNSVRDRQRNLAQVIAIATYPHHRLDHIVLELRIYSFLFLGLSGYQLFKMFPEIEKLSGYSLPKALEVVGSNVPASVAWIEVAIITVFLVKLVSEIQHLSQTVKG